MRNGDKVFSVKVWCDKKNQGKIEKLSLVNLVQLLTCITCMDKHGKKFLANHFLDMRGCILGKYLLSETSILKAKDDIMN